MKKIISEKAIKCCSLEKESLMEVLLACDYGTTSIEDRHLCYRKAAKESGTKARTCILT
ncbi:MAG: hypothetical protein PF690_06420 [Deltaproteobacteria bacterium]|jgi:hypothetical protein|nr:hypothetical protein [Deltaproteobacteria bacterium]